eukprot:scaffold1264_cov540-Prasinococcus_capsulatus_cf.AAC.4
MSDCESVLGALLPLSPLTWALVAGAASWDNKSNAEASCCCCGCLVADSSLVTSSSFFSVSSSVLAVSDAASSATFAAAGSGTMSASLANEMRGCRACSSSRSAAEAA